MSNAHLLVELKNKAYAMYALVVFLSTFLFLYPWMLVAVHFKSLRVANHWLYRIWGYMLFFCTGIPFKVEGRWRLRKSNSYIFCANHTSYIDIPALYCALHHNIRFIGKSSLGKVPLFGYIYSRVHILVDRRDKESKNQAVSRAKQALQEGDSVVIFPEGTIPKVGQRPEMIEFKDGAFKIAIEKQVDIVPISLPYNYHILPDDDKKKARRHTCKVVIHEPISTVGLTLQDVPKLKAQAFAAIEAGIKVYPIGSRG